MLKYLTFLLVTYAYEYTNQYLQLYHYKSIISCYELSNDKTVNTNLSTEVLHISMFYQYLLDKPMKNIDKSDHVLDTHLVFIQNTLYKCK